MTPLRRDLAALALLGALLFLLGLGRRDLWNPDEARYAEVAREMRASGFWAVPHLNGGIYREKPPLFFWSIAAFSAGERDGWPPPSSPPASRSSGRRGSGRST